MGKRAREETRDRRRRQETRDGAASAAELLTGAGAALFAENLAAVANAGGATDDAHQAADVAAEAGRRLHDDLEAALQTHLDTKVRPVAEQYAHLGVKTTSSFRFVARCLRDAADALDVAMDNVEGLAAGGDAHAVAASTGTTIA